MSQKLSNIDVIVVIIIQLRNEKMLRGKGLFSFFPVYMVPYNVIQQQYDYIYLGYTMTKYEMTKKID